MKKIIICILWLMTMLAFTVSATVAPSYVIDYANDMITISGVSAVENGTEASVALHVLKPDKTYENSNADDFANVAYAEQTVTNGGTYSFTFKLRDSGLYNSYVGDVDKRYELFVNFVNHAENKAAIEALNASAKKTFTEFVTDFGVLQHSLGFDNLPLYSQVNQTTVLQRLYDGISVNPLDPEKGTDAVELFETITVQVGLNENKITDIDMYDRIMSITTGEMKHWYSNPVVTENVRKGITERISGKGIDSMAKFNELFKEALILEIIETPGGAANVKLIVDEYANDIGVVTLGAQDSAYLKLAGNNYSDYAALRNAFSSANIGTGSSAPRPGGSGGGSGSGSKGSSGVGVTVPNSTSASTPVPVQKGFDDIEGVQWAKEAILSLAEKNIVSYNLERRFSPDSMITREEFVKLLVTLFDVETTGSALPFADVSANDWFYPYVSAAYNNGLCQGISETEFGSGQPIRRQDIAVLVLRAMEANGKQLAYLRDPLAFADANSIDGYAIDSVNSLCSAKILNGNEKGEFLPKNSATRAEAAVIIYGLVKYCE